VTLGGNVQESPSHGKNYLKSKENFLDLLITAKGLVPIKPEM
jgi:hypothetical protein